MLTSVMPAMTRALQGSMNPQAIKQLTQALGNCNQQLTHRGDVQIRPDGWANAGNFNGAFTDLPPSIDEYNRYIGGYTEGIDTNNNFYNNPFYNTQFDYGDTLLVSGGPPGAAGATGAAGADGGLGPSGPPGSTGEAGQAGSAGASGGSGGPGVAGPAGPPGLPGAGGGGVDVDIENIIAGVLRRLREKQAVRRTDTQDAQVSYVTKREIEVVTGVTFDPDTCKIQQSTIVVDVIDQLTPKFVVKEVTDIPETYYGP